MVNATSRHFLKSLYSLCFVGSVNSSPQVDAVGYGLSLLKLMKTLSYPPGGILSAPVKNTRIIFKETLGASLVEARVYRGYTIMHNKINKETYTYHNFHRDHQHLLDASFLLSVH